MKFYFEQIAPDRDWRHVRIKFWKSVDVFEKEGSAEKERGIRNRVLKRPE
jgi:hypothetical protein